jgi:hypothetical protein
MYAYTQIDEPEGSADGSQLNPKTGKSNAFVFL